jgi:hypothetical protein
MGLARLLNGAVKVVPPPAVHSDEVTNPREEAGAPENANGVPEVASDADVGDVGSEGFSAEPSHLEVSQVTYSRGLKEDGVRAKQAMKVELQGFLDRGLFHAVHLREVPSENRPYILESLSGYKTRVGQPTGKARVFVDGSKQLLELTGDAYSPVARPESTFIQLGLAARRRWKSASYDVRQAYTLVDRPRKSKDYYRFVRFRKDVVAVLLELRPDLGPYVLADGSMLVEMMKMLYGDVVAGRRWYEKIMAIYLAKGFTVNLADPCVIHYKSVNGEVHGSITVDDTLFTYSSEEVLAEVDRMYQEAFGVDGYTSEKGTTFTHLGMCIEQRLGEGMICVSQPEFVAELVVQAEPMREKYGSRRGSTPADSTIFDEVENSPLLEEVDRETYRSLNMSLMFAATRTYPECLVAATGCASKFIRATHEDMRTLLKAVRYLADCKDHCVTIQPASERLVCSADCSYAVHPDGYSHSGIALGFEGNEELPDSFVVFSSGK